MKRVGITGGIGCGKSTVVAEFQKLGVPCFVADSIAAEYYRRKDFIKTLQTRFGDLIIDADGNIDKKALAKIVFSQPTQLKQLNQIVHPMVMHDFDCFCKVHSSAPYVIMESAILFDSGFDQYMDATICVYLDIEERIRRVMLRDKCDEGTIMQRISNQLPAEVMMQKADYVILNYEGNPRQRQVMHINNLLIQ
ncbi:MAG: dephospho-CoA kinase [Bacteroidales bacterium]|nr:dephospho-CoA kinase [Bacteroidales bacterium]